MRSPWIWLPKIMETLKSTPARVQGRSSRSCNMAHGSAQRAASNMLRTFQMVSIRPWSCRAAESLQQLAHRLGDGQIVGRLQHHGALARLLVQHDLCGRC